MTENATVSKITFAQIVFSIFRGLILGILGSAMAGAIGSLTYWLITKHSYQPLYDDVSLVVLISVDIISIGIPIGFVIGVVTGLHSGIFGNFYPKPLARIIFSSLGVIAGLWLSRFSPNNLYVFFFEVTIISFATSWLVVKFTTRENKGGKISLGFFYTGICSISSSLLILIGVYNYFKLWLDLMSVPS